MRRRDFLAGAGAVAAGGAASRLAFAKDPATMPAMPAIQLGTLQVSRLLLGSNPFAGYAHKPGNLGQEMKTYYTEERIVATLDEAAANGITAVVSPPDPPWIKLWGKYLSGGGKLRTWIAQPHGPAQTMLEEIESAVKGGAKAAFIQGHCVEVQLEGGTFETIRTWVEKIRSLGVPAGLAAHRPDVHVEAQRLKFPVDFHLQCFYNVAHGDTYLPGDPAKAVETIHKIEKPVIAYKILGAGRVAAKEGFEYALKNIRATDGVCVGVFTRDDPNQIRQNAELTRTLSAQA